MLASQHLVAGVQLINKCSSIYMDQNFVHDRFAKALKVLKKSLTETTDIYPSQQAHDVLLEALNLLKEKGIKSDIITEESKDILVISTEGKSSLNKLAAGLKRRFQYRLIYDPYDLLRCNATAMCSASSKTISISTLSILTGSVDSSMIHEIRHAYLNWMNLENRLSHKELPLNADFASTESPLLLGSNTYQEWYSLDELYTHLGDLIYYEREYRIELADKSRQNSQLKAAIKARRSHEQRLLQINEQLSKLQKKWQVKLVDFISSKTNSNIRLFQDLHQQIRLLFDETKEIEGQLSLLEEQIQNLQHAIGSTSKPQGKFSTIAKDKLIRIQNMAANLSNLEKISRRTRDYFFFNKDENGYFYGGILSHDQRLQIRLSDEDQTNEIKVYLPVTPSAKHVLKDGRFASQDKDYSFEFSITDPALVQNFKLMIDHISDETGYIERPKNLYFALGEANTIFAKDLNNLFDQINIRIEVYRRIGLDTSQGAMNSISLFNKQDIQGYLRSLSELRGQLLPYYYPYTYQIRK